MSSFNLKKCILLYILAPACSDGEVRLLKKRVQICYNQVWGYVCEDYFWSNNDASVVCRELGFFPQGVVYHVCALCVHINIDIHLFDRCTGFIFRDLFFPNLSFLPAWAQLQWV